MPLATAKRKVLGSSQANMSSVSSIVMPARGPKLMKEAEQQVTDLLRQRHRLQPMQEDAFSVRNLEEVFAAQETSSHVMSILLAAIASVSLVVGGIGIRVAIGALKRDILRQFLVEAITLELMGGIIGIVTGLSAWVLISSLPGGRPWSVRWRSRWRSDSRP